MVAQVKFTEWTLDGSFVSRFSWGCEPARRRKTSFANKDARFHYHEDSFQWPLEDPHHCLLFGLLRDYYKRFMAKLSDYKDEDQGEGMPLQKVS